MNRTTNNAPSAGATHRDVAEELLAESYKDDLLEAQVHATLAQVDAIDRLTAAIECMELPALEVSGSVLKGTCRVRPVRR